MESTTRGKHSRRAVIGGGAALVGASLVGRSGNGVSLGGTAARAQSAQPTTLTAADFQGLGPCQLLPAQTEGPFYTDLDLTRRDITEGRAGHPLRLGLQVVDADCEPIPGAVVDVWHCDETGDYSAFIDGSRPGEEGPGSTFLRGVQTANDEGIVEFRTIYPGWYPGRAVHIHLKVHLDGDTALTTQLYLPDDYTDRVYQQPPYASRGQRTTRNNNDFIASGFQTNGTLISTSPDGNGTLGLAVLGVQQQSGFNFFQWFWNLLFGSWG